MVVAHPARPTGGRRTDLMEELEMSIQRWSTLAVPVLALGLAGGTLACGDPAESTAPQVPDVVQQAVQAETADVQKDLALLRRITSGLRSPLDAIAGGWDTPVTDCKAHPPEGGMGYHYASFPYYLDGIPDVARPEIILYAPGRDGALHLAAVEYIVAGTDWPDRNDPPQLFGRDMDWSTDFEEWQLHVWLWEHNPAGLFAPWNPRVSCEGWEDVPAPT